MKKFINILSVILLVLTFVVVILLVFTRIQGKTPQVFGYQLLRVSSASMEPKLYVGDVILSHKVKDVNTLKVGDVITYTGNQGSFSGKLITHEVVKSPEINEDGEYCLQTMGIANSLPDPVITDNQVVGKMVCKVPFLSFVYGFFQTYWGLIIILLFLAILFINEIFRLFNLINKEKTKES